MRWPLNPFARSRAPVPEDPETANPRQVIQQSLNNGFQIPTQKFTAHQIFYIFVLDGIGALILSGAINFAIAYGMSNVSGVLLVSRVNNDIP